MSFFFKSSVKPDTWKVSPQTCLERNVSTQTKNSVQVEKEKRWRFPILLSLAFGFHYVPAPGACRPVREPTVIWFIEIIWQGNRAWKMQLQEPDLMNFLWFGPGLLFPVMEQTPRSTRAGDEQRRGSLKLQCGLCFHTSWIAFPIRTRGPGKWSRMLAGNHTEWRLPLSLTINVPPISCWMCGFEQILRLDYIFIVEFKRSEATAETHAHSLRNRRILN